MNSDESEHDEKYYPEEIRELVIQHAGHSLH